MPAGRIHDRITLWSLPIIAAGTLVLTSSAELTFWLSGGFLFSGLMFGPDLDLNSRQSMRWGVLKWIWVPYKKAIRHRSIWSHGLLVGTIGRIIYLSFWLALAGLFGLGVYQFFWGKAYTSKQLIPMFQQSLVRHKDVYISLFCGLELGAMSHFIADGLVSTSKRFKKGKAAVQNIPKSLKKKK